LNSKILDQLPNDLRDVMPLTYIPLTVTSASEMWESIVIPDVHDYFAVPGIRSGFHAATSLNHLLNWIWHEANHDQDTRGPLWASFQRDAFTTCPELRLLKDLCNGLKHRGLKGGHLELQDLSIQMGRGGAGGYGVPSGGYGVGALAFGSGIKEPALQTKEGGRLFLADIVKKSTIYYYQKYFQATDRELLKFLGESINIK
jgi:hypothetical protein